MDLRDLFVAGVAIGLGGMMIYSAMLNEGWCFEMKVARVISETKGRAKARTFIGTVGTLMILLGLYILLAPTLVMSFLQSDSGNTVDNVSPRLITLAESE